MKFSSKFLSLVLTMSTHVLGQNFADLCDNISLIGSVTLGATCLEGADDQDRNSTIDLNKCLGNINGVLKVRYSIIIAFFNALDTNSF
jgi:hypothetical protein